MAYRPKRFSPLRRPQDETVDQLGQRLDRVQDALKAQLDPMATALSEAVGTLSTDEGLSVLSPSPAGSYTNSDITVDAYGRVTVAASGAAGAALYIETSGNYTVASAQDTVVAVTTAPSSADTDIALPPAAGRSGQVVVIKDKSNVTTDGVQYFLTVIPAGADTIDGVAAQHIMGTDGGFVHLVSDGVSDWTMIDASPAWGVDPRSISNIKVWYAADRSAWTSAQVATSAFKVASVKDLSGNGLNASPNGAGRPYYVSNGRGGIPAFICNGDVQFYTTNTTWSSSSMTILVVMSHTNQSSGYVCSYNAGNGVGYRGFRGPNLYAFNTNALVMQGGSNDAAAAGLIHVWDDTRGVTYRNLADRFVLDSQLFSFKGTTATATNRKSYMNGREVPLPYDTENFLSGGLSGAPITFGNCQYGGAWNGAFYGSISELILYDNVISDADFLLVNDYLRRKYGCGR